MDKIYTYCELVDHMNEMAEKHDAIRIILENVCGDGYDAYSRAYTIVKAFEKIIEKQIPKKPEEYFGRSQIYYYICPSCGTILAKGNGCHNNDCNQKIDWSEVE